MVARNRARGSKLTTPSFGRAKVLLVLDKKGSTASVSSGAQVSPFHGPAEIYPNAGKWSAPESIRDLRFDPKDPDVLIVAGADGTVRSWNYVESKTSSQRVKESNTKTVWDKKQTRPLHETAGAKAAGLYQPAPNRGLQILELAGQR